MDEFLLGVFDEQDETELEERALIDHPFLADYFPFYKHPFYSVGGAESLLVKASIDNSAIIVDGVFGECSFIWPNVLRIKLYDDYNFWLCYVPWGADIFGDHQWLSWHFIKEVYEEVTTTDRTFWYVPDHENNIIDTSNMSEEDRLIMFEDMFLIPNYNDNFISISEVSDNVDLGITKIPSNVPLDI